MVGGHPILSCRVGGSRYNSTHSESCFELTAAAPVPVGMYLRRNRDVSTAPYSLIYQESKIKYKSATCTSTTEASPFPFFAVLSYREWGVGQSVTECISGGEGSLEVGSWKPRSALMGEAKDRFLRLPKILCTILYLCTLSIYVDMYVGYLNILSMILRVPGTRNRTPSTTLS